MANAHAKPHHDYHLVNPSPWPAVGATSAFLAAVGAILWMHQMVPYAPLVLGAIIGSIFLIDCLFRAMAGHFKPTQHLGFEFAAWYWHFVDVVWLFLFACIYVWGGGPHAG